jgi:hypothetical protein
MKELNTQLIDKPYPGCESQKFRSDEYFTCLIRQIAQTIYHPVSNAICKPTHREKSLKRIEVLVIILNEWVVGWNMLNG